MTEQARRRRRRIVVLHSGYGCESGCCGHFIGFADPEYEDEVEDGSDFTFWHPPYDASDEEIFAWARDEVRERFGDEHVADLDWDNCRVMVD